ncbi:DEAD/DEAH box helicase [Rhodobacteraceae bacterium HTCC2150]|nr:DEAD/DEAH box helicase [Rhodobacteraceae bacterium HTCC2150]
MTPFALPIDDALPDLLTALANHKRAVLQAPPGAGKTTRVPLAMLEAGLCQGRILMLEPRRLAARTAAERMAETLGQKVGETVGYRMRGEAKTSSATKIEVVTEGILTRMIQSDPELTGIGAVIFDEFHERSLNADLGLALTWEIANALREDLLIVVMSATLDAAPVAALLDDAPLVSSSGRAFDVSCKWLDRPPSKTMWLENGIAALIRQALSETEGDLLVFLPGEGEIRRTETALKSDLPNDVYVTPLFGAMPFADQRRAIRPLNSGRKIVLSTSIAETSLTIPGITVVIDAGRSRRSRFDPASGMARLVTEKVSRAEATQRMGRAGRVAPGHCYRYWTKGEEGALAAFPPAEIEATDLSGLALELAQWGANPQDLSFLTPPPAKAFAEAQALLQNLGALDHNLHLSQHGRALAALPLHPRLGHMMVVAGKQAAPLAALLADRDPLRGAGVDLTLRLQALDNRHVDGANRTAIARIKDEAKRLAKKQPNKLEMSVGEMVALAYPDRIGLKRKGDAPRWVLSGGKGATMPAHDHMVQNRLIVASDLDGDAREAKIRQAVSLSDAELRGLYSHQIKWQHVCSWSKMDRRVLARHQETFGALILDDRVWADAPDTDIAMAAMDGVRDLGLDALNWQKPAKFLRTRMALFNEDSDMPNVSDEYLLASLESWLLPHFVGVKTVADIKKFNPLDALRAMLNWDQLQRLNQLAPAHFTTPLGRDVGIDYSGDAPEIQVRLQELFGLTQHPTVGPTHAPLRIKLLSPARKAVQTTMDLPGFWATSYDDVRKDMRGRYPKHPWPENPSIAEPTTRAKPRKS